MMAISVNAQTADPCEGLNDAYKEWAEVHFPKKDVPGRKEAIEKAKTFIEKFGSCPAKDAFKDSKEFVDYVSGQIPVMEKNLKRVEDNLRKAALIKRFESNLNKNWDEVYAAGKAMLAEWPDEFRDVKLALGTIGYDETRKNPPVTKWNDETIRYAKESIADLETGKAFNNFGVKPSWFYEGKNDALGWMNFNIGYIYAVDKKNNKEAASYMFKASQIGGRAANYAEVYRIVGLHYVDVLNAEILKLKAMPAVGDTDSEEVKKQKDEAIRAQLAVVKGTADRALEAYGRAHGKIDDTAAQKAFKDGVLKTFKGIYEIRFSKLDGADAMVKTYAAKPFVNPNTPITPIVEDVTAATTSTSTPPVTSKPTGPITKPVAPTAKPASVPATKPAGTKPGVAKVKKAGTR